MKKGLIPIDNWFTLGKELIRFEYYFNLKDNKYFVYEDKLFKYDSSNLNHQRLLKLYGFNPDNPFEIDYITQFHKYVETDDVWNASLWIEDLPITTLGKLKHIRGYFSLSGNKTLKSLGNLERIDFILVLENSELTDLGNLKYIGDDIWLYDSKLDNIGKLEYVEGYWCNDNKKLKSLYEKRINTNR